MRAWLSEQDGSFARGELPSPEPGAGEILVDVSVCGLCRTDLHILDGEIERPRNPIVPGHQVVGRVVRGGTRFTPGARVGIAWLRSTCGTCDACVCGAENLCRAARFTGYHEHGGMAEQVVVPEAFAYAVPEGLDDAHAAPLLCAGIIGYRALKQADVRPGSRVGLYGFGSSAHIALQVAQHWDCEVVVVTRGAAHRELARAMGAVWVGGSGERPPEPLDSAVVFAPAGALLRDALACTRWGGTVASACIHMSPVPELDYAEHLFGERTLRSTTANTRRDGEALLAIAAEGGIETQVTEFAFEACADGLQAIRDDDVRGSAVLRVGPPR